MSYRVAGNGVGGLRFTILGDSLPVSGTGFFGVVSTAAFTTADVTSGPPANEIYSVDNLTHVQSVSRA